MASKNGHQHISIKWWRTENQKRWHRNQKRIYLSLNHLFESESCLLRQNLIRIFEMQFKLKKDVIQPQQQNTKSLNWTKRNWRQKSFKKVFFKLKVINESFSSQKNEMAKIRSFIKHIGSTESWPTFCCCFISKKDRVNWKYRFCLFQRFDRTEKCRVHLWIRRTFGQMNPYFRLK